MARPLTETQLNQLSALLPTDHPFSVATAGQEGVKPLSSDNSRGVASSEG